MRHAVNIKLDLLVAAALTGIALLTAGNRGRPAPRAPAKPATPDASLAALRQRLTTDREGGRSVERERASHGRAGQWQRVGQQGREQGRQHGRDATTPSEIPARGWWQIGKRVFANVSEHRLMSEAAGVTFFGLLALFPALAALVSLYGLVADPATVSDQLKAMQGLVPGGGMDIIGDQLKRVTATSGGALGFGAIFGLLLALWSANGGTKSICDSLNVVYEEEEKRSFLRRTLLTLAITLGALLFVIIALVTVVVLPIALNFVGLSGIGEILLRLARWPILLVVVAIGLAVIYRFGPSRDEPRWRWVSWGGMIAAVLWVLVSAGFSYYVSNFGSYNKTYGSLGAVVGFMTWIWISTIVILIGAEIDAEMEHQTARDTTKGPEKPLGMRGATMADEVAG